MSGWLRTLSGFVKAQRGRWASSNPSRLKYEPGPLRRLFEHAAESPIPWVVWLLAAFAVGTGLLWAGYLTPPYRGLLEFAPLDAKYSPSSAFVGLWAVQAAMVAVVYPIVVAFVTVLIQRQAASKASLQAYFVASGAKLTGLSSLGLVLVMAVQFIALDSVPALTGFAWLVADAAWFVGNAALSMYFLATTFQFASPDGRIAARNRYVLTRAWPQEWVRHLSRLVALQPVKHGLLRATDAMDDLDSLEPAFSTFPRRFGTTDAVRVKFRGASAIVDIRYRFVQWAFDRWAKRVAEPPADALEASTRPAFKRKGPVLEAGVMVHQEFTHLEPIYRVSKSHQPGGLERMLLRLSVQRSSRQHAGVTVLDALDEARLDASTAIQQDSVADFDKRLHEFLDFFDQLVDSSNFVDDEGKPDNWALLQSSETFWGESPIIQQWEKAFLDLHSVALSAVGQRSDFAESTIRVPGRFFARQVDFLCPALKKRYISLEFWHIRLLLDWGAERLDAGPRDASGGRVLGEPLRRRYEAVLKEGVSAWESLKNWRLAVDRESVQWEQLQEAAPLFELHLRHSAQLVAVSLRADDRAAVFWLGDSFLKWRSQLERYRGLDGAAFLDQFKVLYDDLHLSLQDFRSKFPLASYERESGDTLHAAWHLAMTNLWVDVGLLLVSTAINHPGTSDSQRRLTAQFILSAMRARSEDGASANSERIADGPDRIVASLIRVHALGGYGGESYNGRIEKLAESLVPSAVSEGIAGRIYSSVGSSLESLDDGYLFLVAALASDGWRVSSSFDEAIEGWRNQDDIRQRLRYHLQKLRERATGLATEGRLEAVWRAVRGAEAPSLAEKLPDVANALGDFIARLDAVRVTDIKNLEPHRLQLARIEHAAREALQPPFDSAPLCFFASHEPLSLDEGDKRSLRIAGWDKGTLTQPRMAEPTSNESEYLQDALRQVVSVEVVRDLLKIENQLTKGVSTKEAFRAEVERFGRESTASGERPLLLVASRADPSWLMDLARPTEGNGEGPALRYLGGEHNSSYIGHLGDTEVHIASVPRGESNLCVVSQFEGLALSGVMASTLPEDDPHRCTLVLSWAQRVSFGQRHVIRLQHALPSQKGRRRDRKAY